MTPGTRENQQVLRGNRQASRSGVAGQTTRRCPHRIVDRKCIQRFVDLSQDSLFALSAGPVPEFQLHHGTPARLTRPERRADAVPNVEISVCAQPMDPRRRVHEDHESVLPPQGPKLPRRNQVGTRSSMSNKLSHAHAAIELRYGTHDCVPLCLRIGELHGILKLVLRNINCGFQELRIARIGIHIKDFCHLRQASIAIAQDWGLNLGYAGSFRMAIWLV